MRNGSCWQQYGIATKRFPEKTRAVSLTTSPPWPTIAASMVSGCRLNPSTAAGRSGQQRDGTCYNEAVRGWDASDRLGMLCAEDAISTQPYLSTCWMVQRLTSRSLARSRWLIPFDRSRRMYSRCCSLRLGRRPGKQPRSAPSPGRPPTAP